MSKNLFFLISFVVVAGLVGSAAAVDKTWLGTDNNWFNPANWDPAGVPERGYDMFSGDIVHINGGLPNYPVINTTDPCACCRQLWLGSVENSSEASLTIEAGGELTVRSYDDSSSNQAIVLGQKTGTHGTLTMTGGTINMTAGEHFEIGGRSSEGSGTFNMNGGNFNNGDIIIPGFGCNGEGTLNLDGGVIDCNDFMFPGVANPGDYGVLNVNSGTLICDYMGFYFAWRINLYGGVIDSNDFKMWGTDGLPEGTIPQPQIDIRDGIWYNRSQKPGTAKGRKSTWDVRYYINRLDLVAYGGRGTVLIEWDNMNPPDPNGIHQDDLEALMDKASPIYDPNVYWWVRADFDPNIAYWPSPADGFSGADPDQTLSWTPAYNGNAALHDVYFSEDFNDVNDANAVSHPNCVYVAGLPLDQNYIAREDYWTTGSFEMGNTYYWRIDEVNGIDIWKGPVWSFSISYVGIDDFESYIGLPDLRASWKDRSTQAAPKTYCYAYLKSDQALGSQSMFLDCWNTFPPRYAEVRHTFAEDQDWSAGSTKARLLAFSVYGTATNPADYIFVRLEDSDGGNARQQVSDANAVKVEGWTELLFALNAFDGVNLAKINKIIIGVGPEPPVSVGAGTVKIWVDNVRLYLPECNTNYLRAPGDINGNCTTDFADLDIMVATNNWLVGNWDVEVTAPAVGPVLHYEFDGNSVDSSGNGYDGTVTDPCDPNYMPGHSGQALVFNGSATEPTHVDVPLGFLSTIDKEVTVSFWMNSDETSGVRTVFAGSPTGGEFKDRILYLMLTGDTTAVLTIGNNGNSSNGFSRAAGTIVNKWTHWAVTKDCDANEMAIYINGELLTSESFHGHRGSSYNIQIAGIDAFALGCDNSHGDVYGGLLDDFRVYDYALTQAEVLSLAGETVGSTFIQPLQRLLNTASDINLTGAAIDVIDFKDFAILAQTWLQTWTFGDYPDNIYP